jgi:hypothetical protein
MEGEENKRMSGKTDMDRLIGRKEKRGQENAIKK